MWGVAGSGRWVQASVLALPALILAERAWDRRWMTDDGFINLRISRMILDGHGPVFNVGERVEPATSTLWVWIVAAGDLLLPMRMEWVAIVLGLVGACGGLALATFGSARLFRSRGATGVLVPAGALVVAAVPPFWEFSTSGLEGGLTFGWLGLTGWLLCRWAASGERFGGLAAVAVGAAPLVRPDLAVALPLVLGGVLAAQWVDDRARDRVRLVAQALALPVAYQVFRMGYYGSLLPNTALAKSGSGSLWATGWAYMRDFAQPYVLVVPLACLGLAVGLPFVARAWRIGDRRGLVALVALPAVGVVDALYVMRVGGDYMHGRLLLPALFALVAPLAAVPVTRLAGVWTAVPPAGDRTAVDRAPTSTVTPRPTGTTAAGPGRRAGRALPVLVGAAVGAVVVWAVVAGAVLRRPGDGVVDGPVRVRGVRRARVAARAPRGHHRRPAVGPRGRPRRARLRGPRCTCPRRCRGSCLGTAGGRPVYSSWGIGVVGLRRSVTTCTSSTCSASPIRWSAASSSNAAARRATRSPSPRPGWWRGCPTGRCPTTRRWRR